jgi:hypothetical protein
MIKPIPPPKWQTAEARQRVAQQLGLPYSDEMQDWPWEVATPEGLEQYLQLYSTSGSDERVVLMEMILEASTDQPKPDGLHAAWLRIEELLNQNTALHASTAHYWCIWSYDEQEAQEHGFPITPYLREWWVANYPIPTDSYL